MIQKECDLLPIVLKMSLQNVEILTAKILIRSRGFR